MYRFIAAFILLGFLACAPRKETIATSTKPPAPPKPEPHQPVQQPQLAVVTGAGHIFWVESETLMPVLEEAQRLKKPVFISFHASWCAPCKVMEEEIFTRPQVYEFLNQKFLNFHADYDAPTGRRIAEIFEVNQLPTILFVNGNGVALERYTGIVSAAELERLGASALIKN